MDINSCKLCNITFERSLSLNKHNSTMHRSSLESKSQTNNHIDYSGLDLSLMRKINALLGIPMPEQISQNEFKPEQFHVQNQLEIKSEKMQAQISQNEIKIKQMLQIDHQERVKELSIKVVKLQLPNSEEPGNRF